MSKYALAAILLAQSFMTGQTMPPRCLCGCPWPEYTYCNPYFCYGGGLRIKLGAGIKGDPTSACARMKKIRAKE